MSVFREYKETLDYTWVLSRQLDRIAEAYSSIDYDTPAPGIRRLYMAVRGLYAIAQILVEGVRERLREASRLIRNGESVKALEILDEVLGVILGELDKKGLLVRYKKLLGVVEE